MVKRPPRRQPRPVSGDSWGRIGRGAIQAGLGTIIVQGINVFFPGYLTVDQVNWLNGLFVFLVGVTQNGLEDGGVIKPILKGSAAADDRLTADEIAAIRSALADRPREEVPFRG